MKRDMRIIDFLKTDIWRITEYEVSKTKRIVYRFVKIIVLSVRAFYQERLNVKASALTYSILFALVPMIALMVAIGRGFGVESLIENWLKDSFVAQSDLMPTFMGFVKRYLETTQGGLFIGIGLIILLVSVMNFFIQVELAFNGIWQVKKTRSVVTQFTMYFSAMLIIPMFIVLSSGISLYVNAVLEKSMFYDILSPLWRFGVKLTPYFINWLVFTIMYLVIPNTKVNFKDAVLAGILAGSAFQLFQILYIKSQVLLSRYDVVYGSFAAIPLLLLWLQISCLIVLLGAEIAYASQNIQNFEYEADSKNISTRYKNFLTLFVVWLIVKRYENQEKPLTSEQIAVENRIPIRLVNQILSSLVEADVLIEVFNESERNKSYQPAIDIHQLSIQCLFEKLETKGTIHFLEKKNPVLDAFWEKTHENTGFNMPLNQQILVKDL
jgi:membrane protein